MFNQYLAQLEAIYQVNNKEIDPVYVSDYIYHLVEDENVITESEFLNKEDPEKIEYLNNILVEQGHKISQKSIMEGVEIFKKEVIDES